MKGASPLVGFRIVQSLCRRRGRRSWRRFRRFVVKSLTLKVPSEVSNVAVVMRIILTSILILLASTAQAQPLFSQTAESSVKGGVQYKGLVNLAIDGKPVARRFVLRLPEKWNGSLVIGAHGWQRRRRRRRIWKRLRTDL